MDMLVKRELLVDSQRQLNSQEALIRTFKPKTRRERLQPNINNMMKLNSTLKIKMLLRTRLIAKTTEHTKDNEEARLSMEYHSSLVLDYLTSCNRLQNNNSVQNFRGKIRRLTTQLTHSSKEALVLRVTP